MTYTLSHIRPDRTAEIIGTRCATSLSAATLASIRLMYVIDSYSEATAFGNRLVAAFTRSVAEAMDGPAGAELEYAGHTFRIDPSEFPPNVCPCCSALVRPGEHAFAGDDEAYCTGCGPWSDGPQCLPANTAHPVKEF